MDWGGFQVENADVEEFRLEKTVKSEKSQDEIEKLMVNEQLSEMERACLLVSSSHDVQRIWSIGRLVYLLRSDTTAAQQKLVPKLIDSLLTASVEVHAAASQSFAEVAASGLIAPHVFVTTMLPTILTHYDSKNTTISSSWLEALLAAIPLAPKEMLKHKLLTMARARGQLSQTIHARQSCCKIVGKMATGLDQYWVKQELLPLMRALAQDVDHQVRVTMCQQLCSLTKALGVEFAKSHLLCEVEKLLADEEPAVRGVALETLSDMVPLIDDESKSSKIVPMVTVSLQQAAGASGQPRMKASQLIGVLCHQLKKHFSSSQQKQMLSIYHKLATTKDAVKSTSDLEASSSESDLKTTNHSPAVIDEDNGAECRRLSAYNLPAMALFMDMNQSSDSIVINVIQELVSDSYWKVRRTVAFGIHEVVTMMGEKSRTIAPHYITLLKDKNPEVLLALVDHLSQSLSAFATAYCLDCKTRQPGLTDFIPGLLSAEQVASACRQWRLHSTLLEQFSCLSSCLTSDQLCARITPILIKHISNNCVLPVKTAACRSLCTLIRGVRRVEQRNDIIAKIISECAQSSNCRQRLLFIDTCHCLLDQYSRSFFKQHFYHTAVQLAKDPVVNVRMRLCCLLPQMKAILLLPPDRNLQNELEMAVAHLLTDRDPDCLEAMHRAEAEMDRVSYRVQSLVTHSFIEEDKIDKEREEEELQWLKDEEEEELSRPEGRRCMTTSRASPGTPRSAAKKSLTSKVGGTKTHLSPGVSRRSPSSLSSGKASPSPSSPRTQGKFSGNRSNASSASAASTTPDSIRRTLSTPQNNATDSSPKHSPETTKARPTSLSRKPSGGSLSTPTTSQPRSVANNKSKDTLPSSNSSASARSSAAKKPPSSQYGLAYSSRAKK